MVVSFHWTSQTRKVLRLEWFKPLEINFKKPGVPKSFQAKPSSVPNKKPPRTGGQI
jgi:hypothetical protein